jgi:hypothetical protein
MRRAFRLALTVAATATIAACANPVAPAASQACATAKIPYASCVNKDYTNPAGDYTNPAGDYTNPAGDYTNPAGNVTSRGN